MKLTHNLITSYKMRLTRLLWLIAFAVATLTGSSAGAAPTQSGQPQTLVSPNAVPEGLNASEWSSIHRQYEQHRHHIMPVAGTPGTLQARNPGQRWRTRFDGRGFVTQPDAGGWKWGLELKSYGFVGHERTVAGQPRVNNQGPRVTYDWDDTLQEWFVNDARGLEHGFTVRERPPFHESRSSRREEAHDSPPKNQSLVTSAATDQGIGASPLTFTLAVRGGLRPELETDGRGVRFVDGQGAVALTYAGLKVFDADGHKLAARFELVEGSRRSNEADSGSDSDAQKIEPLRLVTSVATGELRLAIDELGARYPLTIDPIAQQAYLKASNSTSNDLFGVSVAVSGDTVVVGAPDEDSNATGVNGDQSDNSASEAGAAYVFVRSGTNWSQQAYLKASNTEAYDEFGYSVAVSGNTVVVGGGGEDSNATGVNGNQSDNSATNPGAAYVFVREGTSWRQQAYLKASNTGANDGFGVSVAVSGDTVVVGSLSESSTATGVDGNESDNNAPGSGAAYVFVRSGTNWSQQAYLKASNTEAYDEFGYAVSVSGDTVVIGALGEYSNATGVNGNQSDNSANAAGAAYVFVRSGTIWSQQAYLKASNTGTGDYFGWSVAMSGDTIVIGAFYEDSNATGVNSNQSDNSARDSGAAYVFVRSGTTWIQQAYLKASNTGEDDNFGRSVAVSGDTVVVGSLGESSTATGVDGNESDNNAPGSGAAYIYSTPECCGVDTYTGPILPFFEAQDAYGWRASLDLSSDDGLVIGDLRLFSRYVAETISVPYFTLLTSHMQAASLPPQRGELRPSDATGTPLRSRLVDFTTSTEPYKFIVQATYRIDEIPDSPGSSLCVFQRYEFLNKQGAANMPFEPTGELDAQVVRPIVSYCFTGANGDTVVDFHIPQRLAFWLDRATNNSTGVFRDLAFYEVPQYLGFVAPLVASPLPVEIFEAGIIGGKQGNWDNIHVTFLDMIQEPIIDPETIHLPFLIPLPHAAVEAVHIHWRWAGQADFPDGPGGWQTGGNPRIPAGSDQDLDFAVVRFKPGEEDPQSFRDLVDPVPEFLSSGQQVVWLGATGHNDQDTFFEFGFGMEDHVHYLTGDVTQNARVIAKELEISFYSFQTGTRTCRNSFSAANNSRFALMKGPIYLVADVPQGVSFLPITPPSGTTTSGKPYFKLDGVGRDGVLHPMTSNLGTGEITTDEVQVEFDISGCAQDPNCLATSPIDVIRSWWKVYAETPP